MSDWNSFLFGNTERPKCIEDFALPPEGLKYVESFDWHKNRNSNHFFDSTITNHNSYDSFEQSNQIHENNREESSENQNSLNIFNGLKD